MKQVILRASHFYMTKYGDNFHCVIVKSIQEQSLDFIKVCEIVNRVVVENTEYIHEPYTYKNFKADFLCALKSDFRHDKVIRIIELKPSNAYHISFDSRVSKLLYHINKYK